MVQQILKRRNKSKSHKGEFPYSGLLKCRICGCAYTAEIQKGHIYYHCTGYKGKHNAPYLRQEVLEEQLGEMIKAIQVDEDIVNWVKVALHSSHKEQMQYHKKAIARLHAKHERLQHRLNESYADKLDGVINAEQWKSVSEQWRKEQIKIEEEIAAHGRTSQTYFDEGIKILELVQHAYNLWVKQNGHERRRLLDLLVSNLHVNDVSIYPIYRKPFDIIARLNQTGDKLPG